MPRKLPSREQINDVALRSHRAIEHMASRIVRLSELWLTLSPRMDEGAACQILRQVECVMETLGELLNAQDFCDDEDQRVTDRAFREMRKILAIEDGEQPNAAR